jgi:sensor histidine kinase YesM
MTPFTNKIVKHRSIKAQMFFSFLLFATVLSILFLSMYISRSNQNRILEVYTEQVQTLSDLSLSISRTKKNIENYYKRGDSQFYDAFIESRQEIENTIGELETIFKGTPYYLYVRIVENINDYCTNELNRYNQEITFDLEYYNHQQRVLNAFSVMGVYANEGMSNYIRGAKAAFADQVESQRHANTILVSLLVLGVAVAFIISYTVLHQITEQLEKMADHAKQLTEASWHIPDLKSSRVEELNTLSFAINKMKRSLNEYFLRLREKADLEIRYRQEQQKSAEKSRELYKTQYQLLASKTDPHFLFNTLNIIYRRSMFSGDAEIMKTVSALSEVLRYNLEFRSEFVTLDTELRVLDSYLYIHSQRFDNRLEVNRSIQCDPENILIMPFLLQPIMEIVLTNKVWDDDISGLITITIEDRPQKKLFVRIALTATQQLCIDDHSFSATRLAPLSFDDVKQRLEHVYQQDLYLKNVLTETEHWVELMIPKREQGETL